MREIFPEYFRPTPEGFDTLWQEALFALDTNILLNLYRYTADTRKKFVDVLLRMKDRCWIPNQVALEYLENHRNVREEQSNAYKAFIDALDAGYRSIDGELQNGKGTGCSKQNKLLPV